MERRENESLIDWTRRCTVERDLGNIGYSEWSHLVADYSCSDENARKATYFVKAWLEKFDREKFNSTPNDYRIMLESQINQLEKEKIRFQDARREYKAYLRADARFEGLMMAVEDTAEILNSLKPMFVDSYKKENQEIKCATLILSDWHTCMEINDHLNVYNLDVLKQRVQELTQKVINNCAKEEVTDLYVEVLGDMINGLIHVTTRILSEEDAINQTMIVSEILADMLYNIADQLPYMNIYVKSCIGNHGRVSPSLKDSLHTENFERIIAWYLKTRLKDIGNIDVDDCSSDMIEYTMKNGMDIVAVHGNLDKPNNVISDFVKNYKYVPMEFHMGHLHSYAEFDDCDVTVVVNGTLAGMDSFAKSIRKSGKPCQILRIYDEDVTIKKLTLW